jgi:hypothetical protein
LFFFGRLYVPRHRFNKYSQECQEALQSALGAAKAFSVYEQTRRIKLQPSSSPMGKNSKKRDTNKGWTRQSVFTPAAGTSGGSSQSATSVANSVSSAPSYVAMVSPFCLHRSYDAVSCAAAVP